ncbi:hypothetical protein PBY51_005894 [Eleginops maclovinus]|uniref:Ferric-chelate reductase 1 n=1 Tax=Eleginops maclovinus TaxID=56733 RepID=A0AAN7WBU0_ELEMC|nr:hypothetical protein PBY51_005894 [Eleginops maclovinus]
MDNRLVLLTALLVTLSWMSAGTYAQSTRINRTDCGTGQLCADEPSACDPSTGGECFFLAAKKGRGNNFDFELSGQSDGYIAATLSLDGTLGNGDKTYVCANDNGDVRFFGAVYNNSQLTLSPLEVNSVKGKITGRKIQCTFTASVPVPTTRANSITVGISSGTYKSSTAALGAPKEQYKSPPVDLGNPNATVTNQLSTSTTTKPTTTNHAITIQHSLTQALLIIVGVLGLNVL